MEEKQLKKIHMLTSAFSIALLPPIWAVLAPFIGVSTGAVALVCAGLYATNGNKRQDTFKICLGLILGDLWAVIVLCVTEALPFNPHMELYATLFVLGAIAVMLGETFSNKIYTPAWLCGWAIGLLIMGPMQVRELGTTPLQIGGAMLVGVVYAGVGVDAFQRLLVKRLTRQGASQCMR